MGNIMNSKDSKQEEGKNRYQSIIDLNFKEAKKFFLNQESYRNFELPSYFHFNELLENVNKVIGRKSFYDLIDKKKLRDCESVNHTILSSKNSRYSWRPLQLIHSAIYIALVTTITKEDNWNFICNRFNEFERIKKLKCLSLPVNSLTKKTNKATQIEKWWHEIEQKSIELAMDYDYIINTDITDCYGSIYTHSIAWAIHNKQDVKNARKNQELIGNKIDNFLQYMHYGQTNGIPQGSVLMDFIAEILLGYADLELANNIKDIPEEEYQILRYRDDYRIFINNPQVGEKILKCLTETMFNLGLKLNLNKTELSNNVIHSSIKPDKIAYIGQKLENKILQKYLLNIHKFGINYPNSGALDIVLNDYHKKISKINKISQPMILISIVVDIAYHNPRVYPVCSAIISKLLSFLKTPIEKKCIVNKILNKFHKIPNTGYLDIWLQRISKDFAPDIDFHEPLCKIAQDKNVLIWSNDWITSHDLKDTLDSMLIIDKKMFKEIPSVIPPNEIQIFKDYYWS